MPEYVEVAVNQPQVEGVYHYHLPPKLEGKIQPGHLVVVPFGSKRVQAVVLRKVDKPAVSKTREVLYLLDPQPVVTNVGIRLAQLLAERLLTTPSACIGLMIPPGLSQQADTVYTLTEQGERGKAGDFTRMEWRILQTLSRRGPLRGRQLDRAFPRQDWRAAMRRLSQRGLVSAKSVLAPPSVRPKTVRTVRLAVPVDVAMEQVEALRSAWRSAWERRVNILQVLAREGVAVDVAWIYAETEAGLADLKRLAELDLVILGESEVWRDPLDDIGYVTDTPPKLTRQQEEVWSKISSGILQAARGVYVQPYLLHGVTGSGKTEIYLRAVEATLAQGRQAIVLVPEIALTPQTVRRFLARFPGRVGLLHSRLSPGERYDTWRRARSGALSVIVGPRSALFAPLPDPGLIVVDESHDESYYQSDTPPFYHARQVAVLYAQLNSGVCLMGSATPDVVSVHKAQQEEWVYLTLPSRILAHREVVRLQLERIHARTTTFKPLEFDAQSAELPPVEVVDMRVELKAGNRSIFSRALQAELEQVLGRGEQAILFLNRRGSATYVFCRDCGHTLKCPRCDTPLTYHRSAGKGEQALRCHRCGYQRKMPKTCPSCHSRKIRQYGMGTERVETEINALFPEARTLRWDWDTTRQKDAHEVIMSHFSNHRADILIGTQMLAKGLDLPRVTLVGVVLADVGLNLPDYRAGERTFQLLTQVSGRAGRSPLGGKVILQTFAPEHYVIRAAAKHDFAEFYRQELNYRRELGYPPYGRLVRLEFRDRNYDAVQEMAHKFAGALEEWMTSTQRRQIDVIGPVPCFFERMGGEYRWQIVLRGPDPAGVLRGQSLPRGIRVEIDPPSLL